MIDSRLWNNVCGASLGNWTTTVGVVRESGDLGEHVGERLVLGLPVEQVVGGTVAGISSDE